MDRLTQHGHMNSPAWTYVISNRTFGKIAKNVMKKNYKIDI